MRPNAQCRGAPHLLQRARAARGLALRSTRSLRKAARPARVPAHFCGGQSFEGAPQHLIPSKQPECGRFPSPTNIPSCTTATTPDEEENIPERNDPQPTTTSSTPPSVNPLRRRWANLILRVFKTDPLICKKCGGKMRVVSFITEPGVIRQIVDHLENRNSRDPPLPSAALPRA